jgi:hypothetical protein
LLAGFLFRSSCNRAFLARHGEHPEALRYCRGPDNFKRLNILHQDNNRMQKTAGLLLGDRYEVPGVVE